MITNQQAPYYTTTHYYDTAHVTIWFVLQHLDVDTSECSVCLECDKDTLRWDNYFANVLHANRGRVRVNETDYTKNGFNDVTIAVGLTAIS